MFRTKLLSYGGELLALRPCSRMKGHPLSAVHECLFDIFAATLHIWRLSPPRRGDRDSHNKVRSSQCERLTCKVWGFHSDEDWIRGFTSCDFGWCCGRTPTFRRILLPSSSPYCITTRRHNPQHLGLKFNDTYSPQLELLAWFTVVWLVCGAAGRVIGSSQPPCILHSLLLLLSFVSHFP
jgi:hypothetical protein